VAGATITWAPLASVGLSAEWRHVGRRYGNTANTVWEGAYDLFGLGASWRISNEWTLSARVANLTDETYSATVGTSLVVLGAPRTTLVALDWRF
jgi:iron complex outermembrane receptor protein